MYSFTVRPRLRRGLRAVWILTGLSLTAWLLVGFQAVDVPADVLTGDSNIAVEASERGVAFRSRESRPAGILFLPGGMVEPIAYAPLLRRIAGAGYRAHLLYLPMRCGCTESQVKELFQEMDRVIRAEPKVAWIVAGHSRGGMLATRFVHEGGAAVAGLALLGTTHPRDFSLASVTMPVMKIYGTSDGVASYAKMQENAHLLPRDTTWVAIEGGNHVQFGYYRHQFGDDKATISRAEQQGLVEAALLRALEFHADSNR